MEKLKWGKRVHGIFLLRLATVIASPAQTFTTLHNFDYTDGQAPYGMVRATNGVLLRGHLLGRS